MKVHGEVSEPSTLSQSKTRTCEYENIWMHKLWMNEYINSNNPSVKTITIAVNHNQVNMSCNSS